MKNEKTRVTILKNFPFLSGDDGVFEQAFAGTEVDLPDTWIADLQKKGFVTVDQLDDNRSGKKGGSKAAARRGRHAAGE